MRLFIISSGVAGFFLRLCVEFKLASVSCSHSDFTTTLQPWAAADIQVPVIGHQEEPEMMEAHDIIM